MLPAIRSSVEVCLPGSHFSASARTRTCDGVPTGAHPWYGSVDRCTIRSRSTWTRCAFHPWLEFPRPSSMRWPSGHPKRAFGLVLNLPHRPAPPPAPPPCHVASTWSPRIVPFHVAGPGRTRNPPFPPFPAPTCAMSESPRRHRREPRWQLAMPLVYAPLLPLGAHATVRTSLEKGREKRGRHVADRTRRQTRRQCASDSETACRRRPGTWRSPPRCSRRWRTQDTSCPKIPPCRREPEERRTRRGWDAAMETGQHDAEERRCNTDVRTALRRRRKLLVPGAMQTTRKERLSVTILQPRL